MRWIRERLEAWRIRQRRKNWDRLADDLDRARQRRNEAFGGETQ